MAFWNKKQPAAEPAPVVIEQPITAPVEPEPAPPKPEPVRRRSENLRLRLTPDELAYLTEQAELAGMSRTDYIMAAAQGSPVIVIDNVPQLLQELRRQGANLNQAVRLAHQTRSVELPALKEALQRCAEAQAEVVRMCDHWNMKLRQKGE